MAFPLVAAALTAGASIFGAVSSAKSARETNQANQQLSQDQMAFQERMSNTAHQREVADLRAAGLNPILSANAGASTPGGAMAVMQNPDADLPGNLSNSARAISDAMLARENIQTQKSQQVLNLASAQSAMAQAEKTAGGHLGLLGGTQIPMNKVNSVMNGILSSGKKLADFYGSDRISWKDKAKITFGMNPDNVKVIN